MTAVLLADMKGTASLELCTGQLSWSENVSSPHRMSINLGYLGSKTMVYEMGQTGPFSPCSGERRSRERPVLPAPSL